MAGLDVNAKLTLDSSNFDANMRKSESAATATGRAAAKAAKEAAAAQATAAKYAGDTVTQESRKAVQALNAQKVANRELADVQKLVQRGLFDEKQGADAVAAAYQRQAVAAKAAAQATQQHSTLAPRQAASSVVRLGESGNPGIRAAEFALTQIVPAEALMAVGAAAGFAALGVAAVEGVKKLNDVRDAALNAGKATEKAFLDAHDRAQVTNDDLEITKAKLGDEIALLSGHPGTGLSTALAEARKLSDDLLISLQADRKELESLLKEHEVGGFASMLSGVAATGKQTAEFLADQDALAGKVRAARDKFNAETDGTKDAKVIAAAGERRNAAIRAAYKGEIDATKNEANRLRGEQAYSAATAREDAKAGFSEPLADNSAKIANAEKVGKFLEDRFARENLKIDVAAEQATLHTLQAGKRGAEAARKADELRFKAMEAHVAEWKTLANVTIKAQEGYWQSVQESFVRGSAQYDAILNKRAALAEEAVRKVAEGLTKVREEQKRAAEDASRIALQVPEATAGMSRDTTRARADAYDAMNEERAIAARNAARMAEVQIGEMAGRSITHQAAAMAMAATHTREYGAELERLQQKQAAVRADSTLNGHEDERTKQVEALQRQLDQVQSNRKIQVLQDAYQTGPVDSSAIVGARDAVDEFTRSAQNSAALMNTVVSSALNSANDALLHSLTTRHTRGDHEFKNTGADIARSATSGLLKGTEGKLLGLLHHGGTKAPLGTPSDPLSMKLVGGLPGFNSAGDEGARSLAAAFGAAPAPGIFNLAAPSVSAAASGAASSGGGIATKLLSTALSFAGFFADGGDPPPNSTAWVGERGPELVRFGNTRQTVVPTHKLGGGGSQGGMPAIHIDARGASDPAQTEAAVHRAMGQYVPHIVKAAHAYGQDQGRRQVGKK